MHFLKELFIVGAGGFLGAAARYGVYAAMARAGFMAAAPTLAVNVTGSFLIGFLMAFASDGRHALRLFLIVGVLGGFTTFSAFSHDTFALFNNKQTLHALVNIALNLLLCLACVFAGVKAGKLVFGL